MKEILLSSSLIKKYTVKGYARSCMELIMSLFFYLGSLLAVYIFRDYLVVSLFFIIVNGFSIVRIFTLQHDCSHRSFFPGQRWNTYVGRCLSIITLTPFLAWRWQHLIHHRTVGNLDQRGIGDVD